ncbi:MAG: 16S rRNA (guanine(966)-N(2))-methyltransferase RsmD [Myxococcales bacterium]
MGSLRIIGGSARGRRLLGPKGASIRPTSDRVRQVIFDVLGPRIGGAEVLDLYAGTGALALEALSRGARRARLVDRAAEALELCRRNASALGFEAGATVVRAILPAGLAGLAGPVDFVFADPPYAEEGAGADVLRWLAASGILSPGGMAILEHSRHTPVPEVASGAHPLRRADERRFGETYVSFYSPAGEG